MSVFQSAQVKFSVTYKSLNFYFAKWKADANEHGPRAMTRFVLMQFVEGLQSVAPDRYIFKGGNLLWHYIKTPRSTVDIDFVTNTELEIEQVLKDFSSVKAIFAEQESKDNHSPYGVQDDWWMNTEKINKLRFVAEPILNWFPQLILKQHKFSMKV